MPNWNSNYLQIDNVTDEQIQRIKTAVEQDRLLDEFFPQPAWMNTPNEEGVLPGPRQFNRHFNKLWRGVMRHTLHVDGSRFPDGSLDQRWYYWRTRPDTWGVKWDVCGAETDITIESDCITLQFQTPWAPPSGAWFERLSIAMPNARISHHFNESGSDFHGITLARDGNAYQASEEMSPIQERFLQEHLGERYSIYKDSDHPDHDEVWEEGWDAWCDEQGDQLAEARTGMWEEAEDYLTRMSPEAAVKS